MNAYRVGKAIGNYRLSKKMLSLAVVRERGVLYQRELAFEATRRRELKLLDDVRVLHATRTGVARRSWRDAVLVAVRPDDGQLCVMPKIAGARGRLTADVGFVSFAAATDDAAAGDGGASSSVATDDARMVDPGGDDDLPALADSAHVPDEYHQPLYSTTGGVNSLPVCGFVAPASDVRHCDDPYCTRYAVQEATKHGLGLYPGAPAPIIKNDLPRTLVESAESCATFLRSADAVARPDGGMNTAKKGTKYLLKEKPTVLLRNSNKLRAAAGIRPFAKNTFIALLALGTFFAIVVSCWSVPVLASSPLSSASPLSSDIMMVVWYACAPPLALVRQGVRCVEDELVLLCFMSRPWLLCF